MRITRRSLLVCVVALLVTNFASPLFATPSREIIIQKFDEQVVVHRDSTVDVTENIQVEFVGTNWHGIYRTLPIEYRGTAGFNYSLFIDHVTATDENGSSLRLEQSHQNGYARFKIYVHEPDNSTRTVVLHYRVLDAMRFFEDHDELYWNVTGQEWDATIESASAHIELPEGVTGLHAIAYTGAFMSRSHDADVTVNDNVVEIRTNQPLGYHQGLTAVVGFDKGLVHEPTVGERTSLWLQSNWPVFLPIIALLIMLWLWWTRGRDPERDAITVQYDPPDKLTPGECGALIDDEVAMRDITATLVDLAVKGYITIEQKDEAGLLHLTHHRDYIFHLKKPAAQWTDARPHERALLGGLFFGSDIAQNQVINAISAISSALQARGISSGPIISGVAEETSKPDASSATAAVKPAFGVMNTEDAPQASVALSSLQNHFYTQVPLIKNGIFDALVGDGYYIHRPDTVRQGYIGVGVLIGLMVAGLGVWLANKSGIQPLPWIIAGIASGAIIAIVGWFMPARTITGCRTYAKVLGFEEFLSRVEADRIRRMENAPELFEKFLPYAMALRVEKKWVQAFSGIAMQPPQWYSGPYAGGFQPYLFVNDLNIMASQAGTTMASAPRSAGGSGFGGGGGAGGGFGGGGGGGF